MFEMIGLVIGTVFLLAVASVIGAGFAGVAFLILRHRPRRRMRYLLGAAVIPMLSAAYMWLCVAVLPGKSLFGDISQPLPNGYVLKALGKMPEYRNIERENGDLSPDGVNGRVDRIAVNGPLVAGRYCQSCDPAFVQSKAIYFILDTRTSTSSEYNNLPSLEAAFHSSTPLVDNQFFRSQQPRYVWQQRINQSIMFTPPLALTILYFAYLFLHRRRESSRLVGNL